MQVAFAIGRIIVGLFYLVTGANGLLNLSMQAGYAASKGVPAPVLAVIVSHLLLLLAAVCILTGWKPVVGVAALVIFYLPVTLMIHNFWTVKDPMMKTIDMVMFMKNMALMGSALMFLAIPEPWRWTARGAAAPPP